MADEDDEELMFSLAPGLAMDEVSIYGQLTTDLLYERATKTLKTEYDCKPSGLLHFLRKLNTRSQQYRWSDVLQVPEVLPAIIGQPTINLLTCYDSLSMMQVCDHVASYIANPVRVAQDSMQLYICLNATLTKEAWT